VAAIEKKTKQILYVPETKNEDKLFGRQTRGLFPFVL
jgi:hypothetical protein